MSVLSLLNSPNERTELFTLRVGQPVRESSLSDADSKRLLVSRKEKRNRSRIESVPVYPLIALSRSRDNDRRPLSRLIPEVLGFRTQTLVSPAPRRCYAVPLARVNTSAFAAIGLASSAPRHARSPSPLLNESFAPTRSSFTRDSTFFRTPAARSSFAAEAPDRSPNGD